MDSATPDRHSCSGVATGPAAAAKRACRSNSAAARVPACDVSSRSADALAFEDDRYALLASPRGRLSGCASLSLRCYFARPTDLERRPDRSRGVAVGACAGRLRHLRFWRRAGPLRRFLHAACRTAADHRCHCGRSCTLHDRRQSLNGQWSGASLAGPHCARCFSRIIGGGRGAGLSAAFLSYDHHPRYRPVLHNFRPYGRLGRSPHDVAGGGRHRPRSHSGVVPRRQFSDVLAGFGTGAK